MKYIRTKNGIYEIEQTLPTGTIFNADCLYTDNELIYDIRTGFGIIAKADIIEELCDKFIWVSKSGTIRKLDNQDFPIIKTFAKESLKEWNLYGAIWTDKGLIYVAKLNDKGELELL